MMSIILLNVITHNITSIHVCVLFPSPYTHCGFDNVRTLSSPGATYPRSGRWW